MRSFIHAHNFSGRQVTAGAARDLIEIERRIASPPVLYDKTGSGATPATDPSYLSPNDVDKIRPEY